MQHEGNFRSDPDSAHNCPPDCPCHSPHFDGRARVIFSTGERFALVELGRGTKVRMFAQRQLPSPYRVAP